LEKVTRCKSETASSSTQKNGYTPKKPKSMVGPQAAKPKSAPQKKRQQMPAFQ
jgi:hypothetical protein